MIYIYCDFCNEGFMTPEDYSSDFNCCGNTCWVLLGQQGREIQKNIITIFNRSYESKPR